MIRWGDLTEDNDCCNPEVEEVRWGEGEMRHFK